MRLLEGFERGGHPEIPPLSATGLAACSGLPKRPKAFSVSLMGREDLPEVMGGFWRERGMDHPQFIRPLRGHSANAACRGLGSCAGRDDVEREAHYGGREGEGAKRARIRPDSGKRGRRDVVAQRRKGRGATDGRGEGLGGRRRGEGGTPHLLVCRATCCPGALELSVAAWRRRRGRHVEKLHIPHLRSAAQHQDKAGGGPRGLLPVGGEGTGKAKRRQGVRMRGGAGGRQVGRRAAHGAELPLGDLPGLQHKPAILRRARSGIERRGKDVARGREEGGRGREVAKGRGSWAGARRGNRRKVERQRNSRRGWVRGTGGGGRCLAERVLVVDAHDGCPLDLKDQDGLLRFVPGKGEAAAERLAACDVVVELHGLLGFLLRAKGARHLQFSASPDCLPGEKAREKDRVGAWRLRVTERSWKEGEECKIGGRRR